MLQLRRRILRDLHGIGDRPRGHVEQPRCVGLRNLLQICRRLVRPLALAHVGKLRRHHGPLAFVKVAAAQVL
jgi:hypothetical protein